jgi:hypothetical protein
MLASVIHEGLGHAATALLTGAKSGVLSTVAWSEAVSYGPRQCLYCFPTIRIENEPSIIGPRAGRPAGPGFASGGGGPNSAAIVSR